MSKSIDLGRFLFFSALIAYGLFLLNNEKAPETLRTNLTGMINRRPEIQDYVWIADYAENIVKLAALANLLSVACIFSFRTNCIVTLNLISLFLTTWLIFNPVFEEDEMKKGHKTGIAMKNLSFMGGLLFMSI